MSFSNWRVNLRSIQSSREQARRKLEARDFPADPMGSADAGGGEWNSGGWDRQEFKTCHFGRSLCMRGPTLRMVTTRTSQQRQHRQSNTCFQAHASLHLPYDECITLRLQTTGSCSAFGPEAPSPSPPRGVLAASSDATTAGCKIMITFYG